jgi:hypothetical protein
MGQPLGRYEQVLPEIPKLLDIEIDFDNPYLGSLIFLLPVAPLLAAS